ncbi:uncharacterized protein HMPREF1541_03041 [Cyphellophora europaea CBS 101466]|uniref:WW domain-containing protein n=1 Tax=Cyphellophora europaea (strain CBS 101466) TaxID=1220924 RepID=W2RX62_CYPE1|nr:uncharacterized protein HMPREF1541_03041 [Cyphellophora europaea CBS 101466]ETN41106.1 hypothetical protein HMPREF1541_03041 [Cyphellophora europaea CBS 101466]
MGLDGFSNRGGVVASLLKMDADPDILLEWIRPQRMSQSPLYEPSWDGTWANPRPSHPINYFHFSVHRYDFADLIKVLCQQEQYVEYINLHENRIRVRRATIYHELDHKAPIVNGLMNPQQDANGSFQHQAVLAFRYQLDYNGGIEAKFEEPPYWESRPDFPTCGSLPGQPFMPSDPQEQQRTISPRRKVLEALRQEDPKSTEEKVVIFSGDVHLVDQEDYQERRRSVVNMGRMTPPAHRPTGPLLPPSFILRPAKPIPLYMLGRKPFLLYGQTFRSRRSRTADDWAGLPYEPFPVAHLLATDSSRPFDMHETDRYESYPTEAKDLCQSTKEVQTEVMKAFEPKGTWFAFLQVFQCCRRPECRNNGPADPLGLTNCCNCTQREHIKPLHGKVFDKRQEKLQRHGILDPEPWPSAQEGALQTGWDTCRDATGRIVYVDSRTDSYTYLRPLAAYTTTSASGDMLPSWTMVQSNDDASSTFAASSHDFTTSHDPRSAFGMPGAPYTVKLYSSLSRELDLRFGPLPPQYAVTTSDGMILYRDRVSGTSTRLDPRLA